MAKSKLNLIKKQLKAKTQLTPDLASTTPSAEHTDLLKAAYSHVIPLHASDIYQHPTQRPRPHPRSTLPHPTDQLEWGDEMTEPHFIQGTEGFYRPGQRRDILKRMRRKDWIVQSELDLHGMTGDEAEIATQRFLTQCLHQGIQRVRIIPGKGLSSPNQEPVLKKRILQWLAHQSIVLAFTHAPAAQGGAGALLVLIKKLTAHY
jgi:DNA-nicking Smr family endonuclease